MPSCVRGAFAVFLVACLCTLHVDAVRDGDPVLEEERVLAVGPGKIGAEKPKLFCEDREEELSQEMAENLVRDFKPEELEAAMEQLGFSTAPTENDKPIAVWVLGPAASGKTTILRRVAASLGLGEKDYFVVDGDPLRRAHAGFQAVRQNGEDQGCIWKAAFQGTKHITDSVKKDLRARAVSQRMHVVLPSPCPYGELACVEEAKRLASLGYTNYVVGVYGDKATIGARGHARAVQSGKRYSDGTFEKQLGTFRPFLQEVCSPGATWTMACSTCGEERPNAGIETGPCPVSDATAEALLSEVARATGVEPDETAAKKRKLSLAAH